MKRVLAGLLKAIMGCGLVLIAYELVVWVHAPALAWGISALGRNRQCGAWEGYQGLVDQVNQRAMIERLSQHSKLVNSEGNLNHYRTPHGDFWIPKGSDEVLPRLLAQQQAKIYGEVQPGDVVLDCGAHVGTYARQALRAGARLVVAIEPAPDNVECLRRGFAEEVASGRMIVVPKGVWDREDWLPLYADPTNSAADSFIIKGRQDKVIGRIPLTTIDRIAGELKIGRVTLIKMDIKGATVRALAGAGGVVQRDHPRIVISTEEEADAPAGVIRAIRSLGGGYRHRCGMCSVGATLLLNPDVLLFDWNQAG